MPGGSWLRSLCLHHHCLLPDRLLRDGSRSPPGAPGSCCHFLAACSFPGEQDHPLCWGAQAVSCSSVHGATSPWELLSRWWRMKQGCSCHHPQYGDTALDWQVPAQEDVPSAGRGALPVHLGCSSDLAKQLAPARANYDPLQRGPASGPLSQQVTALSPRLPACCSRRSWGRQ